MSSTEPPDTRSPRPADADDQAAGVVGTPAPPQPPPAAEGDTTPVLADPAGAVSRRQRYATQRRRRRNTIITVLSASLLVLAVGVVVIPLLARGEGRATSAAENGPTTAAAGSSPTAAATTYVMVTHGDQPDATARSITVLSVNEESGRGAVVFVPIGVLLEVPGIGLDRVGLAQRYDGPTLVADSLVDAIGLDVDAAVSLDEEALAGLLGSTGELTVDIGAQPLSARPSEGEEPARFDPGQQSLDGTQLADYWNLIAVGQEPLTDHDRQEQILRALLDRIAEDPGLLEQAAVTVDEASTVDGDAFRRLVADLASASAQSRLAFDVLPVRPFGPPGEDGSATYRIGDDADTVVTSLLDEAGGEAPQMRVEVRDNAPDLAVRLEHASQVEEALADGFRVVLGAAGTEPPPGTTEIIVYDQDSREQAEAVRDRLGVGTITIDEQPQTVVDLTIVLGDDFLSE